MARIRWGRNPAVFFFWGAILFFLASTVGCRQIRPTLIPPPVEVKQIEGHASLRTTRARTSGSSRFSFVFSLPDRGRVEVFDPVGRSLYRILIRDEEAFLIIPQRKVYWPTSREDILMKFLGFSMHPREIVGLLTGRWEGSHALSGEDMMAWTIEKNEKGRVVRGQKASLQFEVREFFPGDGVPRLIHFTHFSDRGRIKLFNLKFNPDIGDEAFSSSFLKDFKAVTWGEVERILEHGN